LYKILNGFAYVTAVFFAFLTFADIRTLDDFANLHDYMPYVSTLIIFFSYLVAIAAYPIMQWIVETISPCKFDAAQVLRNQQKPSEVRKSWELSYADLVMLRHLVAAMILLAVFLPVWLGRSSMSAYSCRALWACVSVALMFTFGYLAQRKFYIQMKDACDDYAP